MMAPPVADKPPRGRRTGFGGTSLALVLGLFAVDADEAKAQVVERNLPPPVTSRGGLTIGQPDLSGATDETPLGVNLSGIRLIGPRDKVVPRAKGAGVVVGKVGAMPSETLRAAVMPYLGRPLTRKLIGDIQATIAKIYRDNGYPFVSVTAPPQEVTGGVLQLRVIEFRMGELQVKGADPAAEAGLRSKVRVATGERIAVAPLEEDLDWINRYPYRTVQGVFAPGDALGTSGLTLNVTEGKPWQVFGGWSNTGTRATGLDRYFVGFGAGVSALNDLAVSYQLTGGNNFWGNPESLNAGANRPNYVSHAGRIVLPLFARQSIELVPSYVTTRQNDASGFLAFANDIFELPVLYRTAVSNLVPGLHAGDLIAGVSVKQVARKTYFTGVEVARGQAELFETILGWTHTLSDAYGRTSWDIRMIANPGGMLGQNNAATWSTFTNGRVTNVQYTYGLATLNRVTALPAGFFWVAQVTAMAASQALPDTEQLALGGLYATRGYRLDDGAVDAGIVVRNELRLPSFAALGRMENAALADTLSPFVFFDYGYGRIKGYGAPPLAVPTRNLTLAGTGAGVDYRLGANLNAGLVLGYALRDALLTRSGDWNVQGRVTLTY